MKAQEWFTATNPATVDAQGRRYGGAFYAQLDHQLLQDVKLIAGFQTNKIGSIPLNTVPRGGVIWTPDVPDQRQGPIQSSLSGTEPGRKSAE